MTSSEKVQLRRLTTLQIALEEEFNILSRTLDEVKKEIVDISEQLETINKAVDFDDKRGSLHKSILGLTDLFLSKVFS